MSTWVATPKGRAELHQFDSLMNTRQMAMEAESRGQARARVKPVGM